MQKVCSCIKNSFDFYITEVSCDKILYQDLSRWMEGENYNIPEFYTISILYLDSGDKERLIKNIEVNGIGVTNISDSITLADGIYEIQTQSCQNTYKKWVAIIPKLQCCLDRYMASEEYDAKKHREAQRLIDGARLTASFNQPQKSIQFYKMAKKLVDQLNCDC